MALRFLLRPEFGDIILDVKYADNLIYIYLNTVFTLLYLESFEQFFIIALMFFMLIRSR